MQFSILYSQSLFPWFIIQNFVYFQKELILINRWNTIYEQINESKINGSSSRFIDVSSTHFWTVVSANPIWWSQDWSLAFWHAKCVLHHWNIIFSLIPGGNSSICLLNCFPCQLLGIFHLTLVFFFFNVVFLFSFKLSFPLLWASSRWKAEMIFS